MMWVEGGTSDTRIPKEASMAAEVIDNVKDFIEKYCKILHLANMPTNVRARFDKYAKIKDFSGNMKKWPDLLDAELPELSDAKLKNLYNLFQSVFENMAQNQKDFADKKAVNDFFNEWYGDSDDKLFRASEPIRGLKERVKDFTDNFLKPHKAELMGIFAPGNAGLPDDFDYDSFVNDVEAGKYLTDYKFRTQQFDRIVNYVQSVANGNSWRDWPETLLPYNFSDTHTGLVALPLNTAEWFTTTYNPGIKAHIKTIFNKLLTSSAVRKDFQKYDYKGTISGQIQKAITETDYANESDNPDNKDFVPPVYNDQKNFLQRVDDKLDKFKENQVDPWTNVLRGTRRYFSPFARNVVEAVASAKIKGKDGKTHKIKPTDGLKGILDNADAIAKKLVEKSPKAKGHFDWFSGKLKIYADKMPKAFEGAFRNPKQMRAIVSQFIVDAVKEGKSDEVKSALEVLSTMKYGIMHSRTIDALKQEDMTVFSDKDLSWNKYEGVKVVTTAMDKTAKFAILGVGRAVAAARNQFVFRNNLKFRGNTKTIEKAYKNWKDKNSVEDTNAALAGLDASIHNNTRDITKARKDIKDALGVSGTRWSKKMLDDLNDIINNDIALLGAQTTIPTAVPVIKDRLKKNQDLLQNYNDLEFGKKTLNAQKIKLENNAKDWDDKHTDKYMELMAFWDMLESFWKSHRLTFAADKMRDNFLKERDDAKYLDDKGNPRSKAKKISDEYLAKYLDKYQNDA